MEPAVPNVVILLDVFYVWMEVNVFNAARAIFYKIKLVFPAIIQC